MADNEHSDWPQELERLERLIRGSPERNRRHLAEFLSVAERARSEESLNAAKSLWWIASMVDQRMGAKEAKLLYVMALRKLEHTVGMSSPLLAGALHSLAYYLAENGSLVEAEPHFQRIVALRDTADQHQRKEMAGALRDYAGFLSSANRGDEAERILALLQEQK